MDKRTQDPEIRPLHVSSPHLYLMKFVIFKRVSNVILHFSLYLRMIVNVIASSVKPTQLPPYMEQKQSSIPIIAL